MKVIILFDLEIAYSRMWYVYWK